jgi:hypothetical protein
MKDLPFQEQANNTSFFYIVNKLPVQSDVGLVAPTLINKFNTNIIKSVKFL